MRKGASITVFLSLILVCVSALICALLESARTAGVRYYLQTAADAAMDNLYSNYHRQLWEQYRLILYEGVDEDTLSKDFLSGKDVSMMVILGLEDKIVEDICKDAQRDGFEIYAANYNCDGQIVAAGFREHLIKFESVFKEAGAKRAMLLNMSVASHCPILESAGIELASHLKNTLKPKFVKVVSNVTAKSYDAKEEALSLLKDQLVKPVLYKQSVKNYQDEVDFFVEFGSNVLKGINKKITDKPTYSITDIKSLDEFVTFLENK